MRREKCADCGHREEDHTYSAALTESGCHWEGCDCEGYITKQEADDLEK